MNDTHGGTGNAAKAKPASAALALLVGLALLLPGMAALATSNPIPGVDIIVKKNPGPSMAVTVPTDADGAYQFKGLAPGKYDLSVTGQPVQTINVDKGILSGVLSREPDGKASITFNGQVGVVPDLPGAPVITTRSHLPRGQLRPTDPGRLGGAGSGEVSPAGGDVNPGISDQGTVGGLISYGTAPPPKDGAGKLPSKVGEHIQGTEIGLEGDTNNVKASARTDATEAVKAEKRPAGFGSGNTFGAGPAAGPGMLPPGGVMGSVGGPGPGMNPMGPGAGGPGGAMRP